MSATDQKRSASTSLEISTDEIEQLSTALSGLVNEYFQGISDRPVFPETVAALTTKELTTDLPIQGAKLEELIAETRTIIANSRHNGHPRFFGYVASPANAPAAFADLIASTLNANVTSWRSTPSATEIEHLVIRWLATAIGYAGETNEAHGLLTSGGSMANLTALLMAHRAHAPAEAGNEGLFNSSAMTIYASEQIHMSIPKAADIIGVGRKNVRLVPTDKNFRIDIQGLRNAISSDITKGIKPFCVVASAGTVNTGTVDPLKEVAAVAKEFGLWFHIDGAYGALASLDETKRPLFEGLALADSISLDPHKWLYVPIDCGCVLFRDEAAARAAFNYEGADYIKVHEQNEEAFAFWNYGPELSRRFRALKIWWTFRYFGLQRIAKTISEDMAMASYLSERVQGADDFELLAPPELSICCFRYVPHVMQGRDAELDSLNTKIMNAVQRGGQAYLSSATIHGKFALRACITNFRTTRADIDTTLEIIREMGRKILSN